MIKSNSSGKIGGGYTKDEYSEYKETLINTQKDLLKCYDKLWKASRAEKYSYLYYDGTFQCRIVLKALYIFDRLRTELQVLKKRGNKNE